MQDDIGGDLEFVAAVIAGSVHKKQDQFRVICNWPGRLHYFPRTTMQNFLDNGI